MAQSRAILTRPPDYGPGTRYLRMRLGVQKVAAGAIRPTRFPLNREARKGKGEGWKIRQNSRAGHVSK